jgi:Peptidase family M23/Glycosyl hydrolase 108
VKRLPGESEDCYLARQGNVSETGQVDDKTEPVPCVITTNSITTDPSRGVSIQFALTAGPCTVTSWSFSPPSFTGVTMSPTTGLMSGTFDASFENTKLTLRVQALNGVTVIDDRTYDFTVGGGSGSDTIRLQHPLPGSIITSGFGPRRPPASGASSNHQALDFAYAGGVTKDVICAADGEVVLARPGSGYGNYVMVKHSNAAGSHLITTLYAHLDAIFVKLGQKVAGGQAIGKEGNTGIGSGAHLHFEVRLPNNTRVDPTPYLAGAVTIANSVNANNTPDETAGTTTVPASSARVTPATISARTTCEAFGPSYPSSGVTPTPPPPDTGAPPTPVANPFEKAWYFTMTHEVNALWMTTAARSPTSPPVAAGAIETSDQRERVGFIDHPKDPGGVTKFGVAQRFNPSVKIQGMPYATARETGYNTYWLGSPDCTTMSPRLAVMVFDIKYAIGTGGASRILTAAGVTGMETGAAEQAACDALYEARLSYYRSRPGFVTFGRGWTRRCAESRDYAKAL